MTISIKNVKITKKLIVNSGFKICSLNQILNKQEWEGIILVNIGCTEHITIEVQSNKVQKAQILMKKWDNFLEISKFKYQRSEAQGHGPPVSAYKISYKSVKPFLSYSHLNKKCQNL